MDGVALADLVVVVRVGVTGRGGIEEGKAGEERKKQQCEDIVKDCHC